MRADVTDAFGVVNTLVSTGLSKDRGSILLNTEYKAKNNITPSPYKTHIHVRTGSWSILQ